MNSWLTHRMEDPAFPTAAVVFVLALEHQAAVSVVFLSGSVELAVHVGAVEDAPILVRIHPLTLQGVVYVETLQGAAEWRGAKSGDTHFAHDYVVSLLGQCDIWVDASGDFLHAQFEERVEFY